MGISDIISIISVLVAPVIAVCVGERLQERAQKRQDKLQIFKTLMVGRVHMTYDCVAAYNIIEIVFADDRKVIEQWKRYYDKLRVEKPSETELKKIEEERNRLLELIAQSLGYGKSIKWDAIENVYLPQGMADELVGRQRMMISQQNVLDLIVRMQENVVADNH